MILLAIRERVLTRLLPQTKARAISPKGMTIVASEAVDYKGWHAQQLSNRWVQLIVVPQNGGRLMQVTFAGHPYLFVNPKFAGKYFPPSIGPVVQLRRRQTLALARRKQRRTALGGDSDLLDDGPFTFRKLSEGRACEIELTGPADPQTGIQFIRTIRLDADSPRIGFHAVDEEHQRATRSNGRCSPFRNTTRRLPRTIARNSNPRIEPRFLDIHSCEPVQQLSQPLSRSLSAQRRILRFR